MNRSFSLVPTPKPDDTCAVVYLSPASPQSPWPDYAMSLDRRGAQKVLEVVARSCDVPRSNLKMKKFEGVVSISFCYPEQGECGCLIPLHGGI
jgi:hypothetical protein